jgi:integrase
MENDARSKYTINFTRKALNLLNQHTNLDHPEQVKTFNAKRNSGNGYKRNLAIAYNKYCKYYEIQWQMPIYHPEPKAIKIPTKEKIQMLVAKALTPLSIKIEISMQTGLRPIELCNLKVKAVDLEQRLIYPTTAKNGSPKRLKINQQLTDTIQNHIHKNNLTTNDKLFTGNGAEYGAHYRAMRNKLADKLHDPTIKQIRLYDLRHYFATTLYAKTRDILLVKQQMGHRKIETTLVYTQLLNLSEDEEYTVKTANNIKEATELLEHGFTYVQDIDGIKLYRKRK